MVLWCENFRIYRKFSFAQSDHFLREKSIIMPDRELRHMRRTELVEIILALKQSEDQLRAENAALSAQLQERQIHIENAGSIAQAALELNKVFEAAQAAADEYVASVLAANKNTDAAASALRAQAEAEAQQILAQAQTEAASLKARTQQQCDAETEAAARKRAQAEADCKAMLARSSFIFIEHKKSEKSNDFLIFFIDLLINIKHYGCTNNIRYQTATRANDSRFYLESLTVITSPFKLNCTVAVSPIRCNTSATFVKRAITPVKRFPLTSLFA